MTPCSWNTPPCPSFFFCTPQRSRVCPHARVRELLRARALSRLACWILKHLECAPVAALRAGCPRSRAAGCRRAGRQPRISAARRRGRGCAASALPGSREVASARVLMLLHRRIQRLPQSQIGRLGARHSGRALRSCSRGARPTRAGAHLHSAAANAACAGRESDLSDKSEVASWRAY